MTPLPLGPDRPADPGPAPLPRAEPRPAPPTDAEWDEFLLLRFGPRHWNLGCG